MTTSTQNAKSSFSDRTRNALSLRRLLTASVVSLGLLSVPFAASAKPLDFKYQNPVSDTSFRTLVRPMITTSRFLFLQPGSPTGTTGFDFGLAATGTPIPQATKDVAKEALADGQDFPDYLALARLTLQKGLPFDADLAANVAIVPDTSILLVGGGLQWTVLNEPFPIPNLALRMAHTQVLGLDSLAAQTTQAEAIASLGFPPGIQLIKPYVGAGFGWSAAQSKTTVTATDTTPEISIDAKASWEELYGIFGLQLSLFPLVAVTAEMQKSAEQTLYSAKLSLNF